MARFAELLSENWLGRSPFDRRTRVPGVGGGRREHTGKRGPCMVRLEHDLAVHLLGKPAANGETEAHAPSQQGFGAFVRETLEEFILLVGADAWAIVGDPDPHLFMVADHRDLVDG